MTSFKKNVKFMLIMTLTMKIFGFLYKILFARFFDMEVLSTVSLLSPILSLSIVLSSMSISTVINKNVSSQLSLNRYYNRGLISSAIKITFISSSIIIIIFTIFSSIISNYIYNNKNLMIPIIITLPLIYFSNFSGIMKSYLEAHQDFKHPIISNMLEQFVKFVWMIFVLIVFKNASSRTIIIMISLSLLICEISSNIYLTFKVKKMTPLKIVKTTFEEDKKILKPSMYLTLFSLTITLGSFLEPIIYYSLSKHVLINIKQTELVYTSLHSFVLPFMQVASFLTYVLVKLLFPKMARTNDNIKTNYYIKLSFYILLFLNLNMFVVSTFYSEDVLFLFFHKTTGYLILKMLAPISFLTFISPILTMALETHGLEKKLLRNGILSVSLGLVSLTILALIQKTSLYSLIYSLIINEITYTLLNVIVVIKKFKLKINVFSIIYILIMILIVYFFNLQIQKLNIILKLIIIIITTSLLYLPLFIRRIRLHFN